MSGKTSSLSTWLPEPVGGLRRGARAAPVRVVQMVGGQIDVGRGRVAHERNPFVQVPFGRVEPVALGLVHASQVVGRPTCIHLGKGGRDGVRVGRRRLARRELLDETGHLGVPRRQPGRPGFAAAAALVAQLPGEDRRLVAHGDPGDARDARRHGSRHRLVLCPGDRRAVEGGAGVARCPLTRRHVPARVGGDAAVVGPGGEGGLVEYAWKRLQVRAPGSVRKRPCAHHRHAERHGIIQRGRNIRLPLFAVTGLCHEPVHITAEVPKGLMADVKLQTASRHELLLPKSLLPGAPPAAEEQEDGQEAPHFRAEPGVNTGLAGYILGGLPRQHSSHTAFENTVCDAGERSLAMMHTQHACATYKTSRTRQANKKIAVMLCEDGDAGTRHPREHYRAITMNSDCDPESSPPRPSASSMCGHAKSQFGVPVHVGAPAPAAPTIFGQCRRNRRIRPGINDVKRL
eukprot:scaffold16214_cov109-Isochrysis_galbana.AAC.4